MASEIRVDKINSLSGVGTVTLSPTGVDIAGITTVATLKATTGIVTTLTATTGIVTTLTTNTLTANSTTKVGSGITLSPDGDIFTTGITTFTNDVQFIGDSGISSITYDKSANQLNFVDNTRARFGSGADLSIYHDGSHSRIDETGTGNLMIQSDNAVYIKKGTSENIAVFNADGAVKLYQDSALKITTSDEGIVVYSGDGAGSNTGNVISVKGGTSARTAPGIYMEGGTGGDNSSIHAKYNLRLGCNSGNDISGREVQFTNGDTNLGAFNSNGNLDIDNGNVVIQTSGKGIDFSATGDASGMSNELLDDYEEGTITPSFGFSNDNFNGSYSVQQGYYTKVGNMCHVSFQMVANKGTATGGNATFYNVLPFAAVNQDNARSSGVVGYYEGFTVDDPLLILIEQNQTGFPLRQASGSQSANVGSGNISQTFRIYVTVTYFTYF